MDKKIAAPTHLGKSGKTFWKKVMFDFALEDGHHLTLLAEACECLDRITEARLEIGKDGSFIVDRFGTKREHPAVKTQATFKVIFARLVREIGLDLQPPDSRPPAKY